LSASDAGAVFLFFFFLITGEAEDSLEDSQKMLNNKVPKKRIFLITNLSSLDLRLRKSFLGLVRRGDGCCCFPLVVVAIFLEEAAAPFRPTGEI
jgi:hypothetical protein